MRSSSYPPSSLAFDWVMAVLAALLMAGVIQDGWAHQHGLVDQSFFTPWHAILYSCMAINGVVLGLVGLRNLRRGYSFRRGLPYGYWTSLLGVIVFATGGVFDLFWHTLYGIETDITGLISISHLWLAMGGALVFVGPLRSIARRYGEREGGWKIAGPPVLCCAAMMTLFAFFTQYASLWADNTTETIMAPNRSGTTGGELYAIHADGSGAQRLLTLNDRDIWGAATSPDGKYVAYRVQRSASGGALPPSDVYVARADGTNATRITHSGRHDTQIAWAPDSTRLAYVSMPAGTSGHFSIVTVNRDGSGARTIVDGTTTVQNPAWSPDGTSIVFQSRNGLHPQLAIVPSSGGTMHWLASTAGGDEPSWTHSGAIVFSKDDGTLAITDERGARLTQLQVNGAEPSFSPDGTHIAYASEAGGATQIFIARTDGSHAVNVTRFASLDASHPSWRSNTALLFTATGRPRSIYTPLGKAYSMDAVIVSSLVTIGLVLMLVRRWRMPLGSMTVLLGLYAIALATQSDTYWDIPAALIAGIVADILLALLKDGARTGNGLYAFAFIVPCTMTAAYIASVAIQNGGLGWPPNMTIGAPFIAGLAGLIVSFCFAPPLAAVGEPVAEETFTAKPAVEREQAVVT